MKFRFRKSIPLGKNVRLNLSKKGPGLSVGLLKWFRIGMGTKGAYTSTSIPKTGLYSIDYLNKKSKAKNHEK